MKCTKRGLTDRQFHQFTAAVNGHHEGSLNGPKMPKSGQAAIISTHVSKWTISQELGVQT